MNHKTFLSFLFATLAAGALFGLDGREVMKMVEDRPTGTTSRMMVQMSLVSESGETRNRTVEELSMKDSGGLASTLIIFHEPASVKDTRFLTKETKSADDDQWIYLPALKKVRRIAASQGSESFMGTEFTYDDMKGRELEDDTHNLLKEESYQGKSCYVVESLPKDPSSSQYSKRVQWVDKESLLPIRIELYDKAGKLLKVNEMEKYQKVQGFWSIIKNTMKNVQTGNSTVLEIKQLVYNGKVDARVFTTTFLESGRL
jgi:hypothetical protein